MPSDLVRRINLDLLYPPFLEALLDVLAECRAQGVDYRVYSGYRSRDQQAKLYQVYLAGGSRAAPAGMSAHNYGLAVDCARELPDKTLSWAHADYDLLLKTLPGYGLKSGAAYKDKPHINWPGYETGPQLRPLNKVFLEASGNERAKLKAVWAFIDNQD